MLRRIFRRDVLRFQYERKKKSKRKSYKSEYKEILSGNHVLHANREKERGIRLMKKKINKGALLQVTHGLIAKCLHVSM